MATYILSPLAVNDLLDTTDYTEARWGRVHRDSYIHALNDCFGALSESPGLGRSRDDVIPGLRSLSHKQHVIFYRSDGNGIEIVRILHSARDTDRHF